MSIMPATLPSFLTTGGGAEAATSAEPVNPWDVSASLPLHANSNATAATVIDLNFIFRS